MTAKTRPTAAAPCPGCREVRELHDAYDEPLCCATADALCGISVGERPGQHDRMVVMDNALSQNGHLSPRQAADLLGCSPRTVRRAIEGGRLGGTLHPCQTTREAVDAYRLAQQGLTGEVVAGSDTHVDSRDKAGTTGAESQDAVVLYALREIERLALELGRRQSEVEGLCREVARLEAEREQGRQSGEHGGQPNGHGGQRGGMLARLGPWLRR